MNNPCLEVDPVRITSAFAHIINGGIADLYNIFDIAQENILEINRQGKCINGRQIQIKPTNPAS